MSVRPSSSETLGSNDEAFRGWGGEDDDLYERLKMAGYSESEYPAQFVTAINHDDVERTLFHEIKEKKYQFFVNRFYTEAKLDLMKIIGKELPLTERQLLMKKIKAEIMAWSLDQTNKNAGFTTTFSIPAWLPEPFKMVKNYTITLNMQNIERIPLPPIN